MKCTACGSDTEVHQTRTTPGYFSRRLKTILLDDISKYPLVRRRRHCSSCEHRFTTYEIDQEVFYMLFDKFNSLTTIREALDTLSKCGSI